MNRPVLSASICLCLLTACAQFPSNDPASAGSAQSGALRVFLLDADHLLSIRQRLRDGDRSLAPALTRLEQDAKGALNAGPYSVVNKDQVPPSGDKHDYMSLGPYWWPNPDTADGLPYVQRDGERNPEIYQVRNRLDLGEMCDHVETLAVAWFHTGEEAYAEKAALLLRTWFLDPATLMNPNLEFGQAVKGHNTGRGIGLIETRSLARVVDAIGLLAGSKAWTAKDRNGMKDWFDQFLQWMLESGHGRDEAAKENNHGTYYDVQIASYAFFVGKPEVARKALAEVGTKRIAVQIEPDGRQPLELDRTKAWSYSVGNLAGLMSLARLGERVGVDLWRFETDDGRSIRKALDYLVPFGIGEREFPYPQINGWSADIFYPLLRLAARKYPEGSYRTLLTKIPSADPASRSHLVRSPLEPVNQLHVR